MPLDLWDPFGLTKKASPEKKAKVPTPNPNPNPSPSPTPNPNPNPIYWVGKSSDYSLTPAAGGGVARIYCIGTPLTLTLTRTLTLPLPLPLT